VPEARVVFVGDAVLKDQPPFLAGADLPVWLDTLKLLLSPAYRNWIVVSGRGGVVAGDAIRAEKDFLEHVLKKLEKLARKKAPPDAIENLVAPFLGSFKGHASQQQKYAKRLRYGLHHYYLHHYRSPSTMGSEE